MKKTLLALWACTLVYAAIGLFGVVALASIKPSPAALTEGYGIVQTTTVVALTAPR